MKKLFLTICVALLSMGAQAQEKGDFAVGVHTGATITKIQIEDLDVEDNTTQWGFGAFGQYNLSNHWRVELEGLYHPMKDHVSDFLVGLDFHYLINLTKDHNVKLYPLLGYALQFVHSETYTEENRGSKITVQGSDDTDGGIQLGAGLQVNFADNWFATGEYRWQPGIFGDGHVVMVGVGYRF